jgi:hypothetical protein
VSTGRTFAAATVLSLFFALIGWTILGGTPESAVAAATPLVEEIPASEAGRLDWPDGLNHYMVTLGPDARRSPAESGVAGGDGTLHRTSRTQSRSQPDTRGHSNAR